MCAFHFCVHNECSGNPVTGNSMNYLYEAVKYDKPAVTFAFNDENVDAFDLIYSSPVR